MIRSLEDWNALAMDGRSLDGLRAKARRDSPGALQATAREFEALLVQMMLKSMRQAMAPASSEGGSGPGSWEMGTYQAMLDQQLARSAASRGLGLAQRLVEQLSRALTPNVEKSSLPPVASAPAEPASRVLSREKENFVERLWPYAEAAGKVLGLPARFVLGHAALESGWGRHEIRHPDGRPSHNLFGIKAGAGWKGETVDVMTTEYIDGRAVKRFERFRAYGSYAEAFADYAELLARVPRYARVRGQGHDPEGFARALVQAGYATDPAYAQKLTAVLNSPDLSAPSG